jgi:hypothetical protein
MRHALEIREININYGGKPEKIISIETCRRIREVNVEMDIEEKRFECGLYQAQDWNPWRDLVTTVINFWFP